MLSSRINVNRVKAVLENPIQTRALQNIERLFGDSITKSTNSHSIEFIKRDAVVLGLTNKMGDDFWSVYTNSRLDELDELLSKAYPEMIERLKMAELASEPHSYDAAYVQDHGKVEWPRDFRNTDLDIHQLGLKDNYQVAMIETNGVVLTNHKITFVTSDRVPVAVELCMMMPITCDPSAPFSLYYSSGSFTHDMAEVDSVWLLEIAKKSTSPVMVVNYPLMPEYSIEHIHQACELSYLWVNQNKTLLGISERAFILSGFKTGAAIALYLSGLAAKANVDALDFPMPDLLYAMSSFDEVTGITFDKDHDTIRFGLKKGSHDAKPAPMLQGIEATDPALFEVILTNEMISTFPRTVLSTASSESMEQNTALMQQKFEAANVACSVVNTQSLTWSACIENYVKTIAQIQKQFNFLIIANGPFLPGGFLREVAKNKTVIVLDGASNKVAKIGIKPDIITGDFDSITEEKQKNVWGIVGIEEKATPYAGKYDVKIIPTEDQNYHDLTKAIWECDKQGAKRIDIVCALGGKRIDHDTANKRVLNKTYAPNRAIWLHSEAESLRFSRGNNMPMAFKGNEGDNCGIMAYPSGSFSSEGLVWNGGEDGMPYPLIFAEQESSSNVLAKTTVKLSLNGEVLVTMPGQLPVHHHYRALTEEEVLLERLSDMRCQVMEVFAKNLKEFEGRVEQVHVLSHALEQIETLADEELVLISGKNLSMFHSERQQGVSKHILFAASAPQKEELNQSDKGIIPSTLT